jgi:SSS family solute:Na+ symporter
VAVNPGRIGFEGTSTFQPDAWTSAWKPLLAGPAANPMGVDWFAMIFGLGFVLSFGYWCTNFLVVQRAMAAKNMSAARNTPLVAAIPKMLFPILVISRHDCRRADLRCRIKITAFAAAHRRQRQRLQGG